jgi:hypothetical protein
MEASVIVGYLRAQGVEAAYATSRMAPLSADLPVSGRQEIFVRAEDFERARELLAQMERRA